MSYCRQTWHYPALSKLHGAHSEDAKYGRTHTPQADATVLSTLVVLQHVVSAGGREKHRPTVHVVGMVRRPSTVEVANYLVGELL
jgi:hypothetical protein